MFRTAAKGWGVRCAARVPTGALVATYEGELITNEEAVTFVVSAGPEFKVLAANKLDEAKTLSSFAVSDNRLFLRTATHLYCIGKN